MTRRAVLGHSMLGGAIAGGALAGGALFATPALAEPRASTSLNDLRKLRNPLASAEQRWVERTALDVTRSDEVRAAREVVEKRWKLMAGPELTSEAEALLDGYLTEYAFHYALMAVAGNPNRPRVVRSIYGPQHQWFGRTVPGSRSGGGDNADNDYAMIPVQHGNHYEILGRRYSDPAADAPLVIIGNPSTSMILTSCDLTNGIRVARDGSYRLTVGPHASDDPNHIQTAPGAMYIFIRFSRADWRQVPDALAARLLSKPTAPAWTTEQIVERTVSMMNEDVAPHYFFTRSCQAAAPRVNEVGAIASSAGTGGLAAQSTGFAQLELADDQAFVVMLDPAGAAYHSLQLYDPWFVSLDYWSRQTTLNNAQSATNPDGTLTCVVSRRDPGTANWLDTTGRQYLLLVHRWQRVPAEQTPTMDGTLVDFSHLRSSLPSGTPMATPAQRARQLADRKESFALRYHT